MRRVLAACYDQLIEFSTVEEKEAYLKKLRERKQEFILIHERHAEDGSVCIRIQSRYDHTPLRNQNERDERAAKLWRGFCECTLSSAGKLVHPFLHFPVGTDRAEVWKWFDSYHSKGVAYLRDVYGDAKIGK